MASVSGEWTAAVAGRRAAQVLGLGPAARGGWWRETASEPLRSASRKAPMGHSDARADRWAAGGCGGQQIGGAWAARRIQMADGGALSSVLVHGLRVGSRLRLGQAVGGFTLDKLPERDILLVAGGTGLAPVKAIAEQVAELPDPPCVHLFFGARCAEGLRDLPDLEKMAASGPGLRSYPPYLMNLTTRAKEGSSPTS